ncbi:ubiquitin-conjugating enzyme/RWD-like protein [Xylariomycetidae sp. FL0641]|nr:ubiquitin-conjugating enzyme/RWD-like protein [Xylariomycetidae sp. FL0641]
MASSRLSALPALRRQHLLVEFAGLKQACPDGVFVSLTPGDPSLWSGVLFVRDGPYAPAVLRFQISFPDSYPRSPPLVTFATEMFHPLISPLSTYMYNTDTQDDSAGASVGTEPLPPGGFSLRHGFPDWFGRRGRSATAGGERPSSEQSEVRLTPHRPPPSETGSGVTSGSKGSAGGKSSEFTSSGANGISTFEVLRYMRSTFDDERVLDSIPLEAAGNPGAWHAWRAHQIEKGKVSSSSPSEEQPPMQSGEGEEQREQPDRQPGEGEDQPARQPGEWNWEGVWEERVKKGISASLSESAVFGGSGTADDVIRFLSMQEDDVAAVKDNLLRTLTHTV